MPHELPNDLRILGNERNIKAIYLSFHRLNDFELITRGFELVTRRIELVTRKAELVICEFELADLNS